MAYSEVERRVAFFVVCIPVRAAVASLFLLAPLWLDLLLRVLGAYALFTVANFSYYAILTARGEYETGGFGGEVWWARLRYVHVALWMAAGVAALLARPWAGWILVGDVAVGLTGGIVRYSTGARL